MSPSTPTSAFSIQPWSRENIEQNSLKEILARVNLERGHFRDITEASLQEEISEGMGPGTSESDGDDADEDEPDDAREGDRRPATREDLFKAKLEMLANVKTAEQDILVLLDLVSLLESTHAPKQAASTISQRLKQSVPMGTFGTDLWQRMPTDQAREAESKCLTANVRMQSLQTAADNLLAAATSLENNARKETQYWDQILAIKEKGWNVSKIPGRQHRLGIRYAFRESSPQFARRGIAAFNPTSDGTIILQGGFGDNARRLQAVVRRNGNVVGISKLPAFHRSEETALESRIRQARDGLFDEELYHEMVRESRSLASIGVHMDGSAVRFGEHSLPDDKVEVSFDLHSLEEDNDSDIGPSRDEDWFAQALVLAARMLLHQGFCDKLKMRTEVPAPLSDKPKDDKPTMPIIRPIMSALMHRSSVKRLNNYLASVTATLETSGVQVYHQLASFISAAKLEFDGTAALMHLLLRPWTSEARLLLTSPSEEIAPFVIGIETTLLCGSGSFFTLMIPEHQQPIRLLGLPSLTSALDAQVACALAALFHHDMPNKWTCVREEARLTQDMGLGKDARNISVQFNSATQSVSLCGPNARLSWQVGVENHHADVFKSSKQMAEDTV